MEDETLTCPECGSENVTLTHVQKFMANTGEHHCHVTKTQDQDSEAGCLDCGWRGWRDDLKSNAKVSCGGTPSAGLPGYAGDNKGE